MEKLIFSGRIHEGCDSEFLIGDTIVVDELENWDFNILEIRLRYTISNHPIDIENVEETVLLSLYGVLEAEHGCIPFSEWTGFVGWDDTLKVGGHDLINELLTYEGKYCYLELTGVRND